MKFLFLISLVLGDKGKWDIIGQSNVVCIHTFSLPNNKVLCVERPHEGVYPPNPYSNGYLSSEVDLQGGLGVDEVWKATATPISISNNPFCAGHAQMADGSILVVGGDNKSVPLEGSQLVVNGRQGVRIFKPCPDGSPTNCTGTWTILPDMSSERWYPTVVTLANGEQIIFGGSTKNLDFNFLDKSIDDNPTYEYYPPRPGVWPKHLDILSWAYPHNLYPQAFLLPSERVFMLVSNRSIILDPKTDELISLEDMPAMDHSPWIYPHTPTMMVLPMTIENNFKFELMICGGIKLSSQDASSMCLKIRPDDPSPKWEFAKEMPNARLMPDSVILPDGKILMVNGLSYGLAGGNQGQTVYARDPVLKTDIFNPKSNSWDTLADATQMRLYHSGALLLETGHVITMGSEMNNYFDYWPEASRRYECFPVVENSCTDPFNYNFERFTPPYLTKDAKRPKITKAPASTTHGSLIAVEMESTVDYDRVTFIRTSTTTHSTNTDQRFIELKVEAKSKTNLYVRLPSSPGMAPPGNWFLFIINKNGVPSVAKTVLLTLGDKTEVAIPKNANENSALSNSISLIAIALLPMLL